MRSIIRSKTGNQSIFNDKTKNMQER